MLLSSHAEAFLLRNSNYRKSPYGTPLSPTPEHIHISQKQLNHSLVAATKATWPLALSLIKALCPLMAANRVQQAALSERFDQAAACSLSPRWPRVAVGGPVLWALPGPWGQGLEKVPISDVLPSSILFSCVHPPPPPTLFLPHMKANRGHAGLIPATDMNF